MTALKFGLDTHKLEFRLTTGSFVATRVRIVTGRQSLTAPVRQTLHCKFVKPKGYNGSLADKLGHGCGQLRVPALRRVLISHRRRRSRVPNTRHQFPQRRPGLRVQRRPRVP